MLLKKLSFVVLILTVDGTARKIKDISISSFINELEIWAKLHYETELFKNMVQSLRIPTELQNSDWRTFTEDTDTAICTICQGTVKTFLKFRREGMSQEKIGQKVIKLCVLMNIQKEEICKGVVELNLPIILYIIDSKPNLTADTICGVILESKSCPLTDPEFDWTVSIDDNPSPLIAGNDTEERMNILQLTDFHYDPLYQPNGNANCGKPLCCRENQNTTNMDKLAGFWGDYESCDTPWHTIIDVLTHIKYTHQNIDYIYFTGDVVDHGVWETSKEGNKQSLLQVYGKIHETFKDTPVYPILGNHEPHPLNQFAPKSVMRDNLTTSWLYELIADLWISYGWLPESTQSTIHQGGFYTVTPKKGFRIIALNNNVCYNYNWWLWYNPNDPDGQLQWLANTLLDAEKNGEFVHILSHMPPNSNSCLKTWKREYLRIINRFSHLIKAEFNGHTHNDEIAVYYNSEAVAKNIAWNGGSITAFSRLNSNYKIYTVNSNNYGVTDYQNWIFDLGAANKNIHARPNWYNSYSFKNEYGLLDLSTKSLNNWLFAAMNNETLINKYYRNFYKQAELSLQESCNLNCKKKYLCRMITYTGNAEKLCNDISKGLNRSL